MAHLREMGQRYLPIVLAVSAMLLYEQLTPSHRTVTTMAIDFGKLALWLLLFPAVLAILLAVAFGYQSAQQRAMAGYGALAQQAGTNHKLFKDAEEALNELSCKRTPAEFMWSFVKSAAISIALASAFIFYILRTTIGGERIINIFVPQFVIDSVKSLFQ